MLSGESFMDFALYLVAILLFTCLLGMATVPRAIGPTARNPLPKVAQPKKTVEEYAKEIGICLGGLVEGGIKKLGAILIEAREALSETECKRLREILRSEWGFKQAAFDAAIMVYEGTLDKRLFFCGVANSKILTLSKAEQNLLLSNEKFGLRQLGGKVVWKTWSEMTTKERNQLLGKKGGGLHPPSEQHLPGEKSKKKAKLINVNADHASFDDYDKIIMLKCCGDGTYIEVSAFKHWLISRGEFDQFVAAITNEVEKSAVEEEI
jgi:hypothetical protein